MFVVGAGGQAGQQALGVQLRPHIAKYLVALVDGASQRDLLRTGNAALLQRHGYTTLFDGGPLHGTLGWTPNSIDGLSAPPTGVSTGDLTDFVLLWKHGDNATNYEYACGSYSGGVGAGITVRHAVIGYRWGAFDLGCSSNIVDSGEALPFGLQFLVHVRSGGSHRLYRNGKLIITVSGTNGDANATSRWGHSNFGAGEWLGFSANLKVIALSGRFAVALTHEQIVALSADPRGFLFDDVAPLAEVAPLATGISLTPETSSTALTGYAPTVEVVGALVPDAATLTLTGYTAQVIQGLGLLPANATTSLTGYAPSGAQVVVGTPDSVTLGLAGYAPTLTLPTPQAFTPGAAEGLLTSYAPEILAPSGSAVAYGNLGPHYGDFWAKASPRAVTRAQKKLLREVVEVAAQELQTPYPSAKLSALVDQARQAAREAEMSYSTVQALRQQLQTEVRRQQRRRRQQRQLLLEL